MANKDDNKTISSIKCILESMPLSDHRHSLEYLLEMLDDLRQADVLEDEAADKIKLIISSLTPEQRDQAIKMLETYVRERK